MQKKQISTETLSAIEKAKLDLERLKEKEKAQDSSLQARRDRINLLIAQEKEAQRLLYSAMNVYESVRRKFYEEGPAQREAFETAKSEAMSARDKFGIAHGEVEAARAELSSVERTQRAQGDRGMEEATGRLWQAIYTAERERLEEVTKANILRLYAARYKSSVPLVSAPDFRQFLEELIGISLVHHQVFKREAEGLTAEILADYNLAE